MASINIDIIFFSYNIRTVKVELQSMLRIMIMYISCISQRIKFRDADFITVSSFTDVS